MNRILQVLLLPIYFTVAEANEQPTACLKTKSWLIKSQSESSKTSDVMELAAVLATEPACKEPIYSEKVSEIVCRALVNDFSAMIKHGSRDAQARTFILRHINASAPESDLSLILRKREYCFAVNESFCQDVIARTEKTLQSMNKKSRSFDRRPASAGR